MSAVNTRFEIDVVASVDVPTTTRAPFEVREDVAINEPTSAAPCKVVDANEDDVVEVSTPTVSEPTVAPARVAVLVAISEPEVTEPIVALLAESDWMIEMTRLLKVAKRFVEVDWVKVAELA